MDRDALIRRMIRDYGQEAVELVRAVNEPTPLDALLQVITEAAAAHPRLADGRECRE